MEEKKLKLKIIYIVYLGGVPKYFKTKKTRDKFYDDYNGHLSKDSNRDRSNYEEKIWIRTIEKYYIKKKFLFWNYNQYNSNFLE